MSRFVVYLKNRKCLRLNNECNRVEMNNSHLCVFKSKNCKSETTLAIIPYDQILYVINKGV